jgi:hypothetical protein
LFLTDLLWCHKEKTAGALPGTLLFFLTVEYQASDEDCHKVRFGRDDCTDVTVFDQEEVFDGVRLGPIDNLICHTEYRVVAETSQNFPSWTVPKAVTFLRAASGLVFCPTLNLMTYPTVIDAFSVPLHCRKTPPGSSSGVMIFKMLCLL